MAERGKTYPQLLDAWAVAHAGEWKIWSEWRYVDGFTRRLFWYGEVRDRCGAQIASVEKYRPDKAINGPDRTARLLWKRLNS